MSSSCLSIKVFLKMIKWRINENLGETLFGQSLCAWYPTTEHSTVFFIHCILYYVFKKNETKESVKQSGMQTWKIINN